MVGQKIMFFLQKMRRLENLNKYDPFFIISLLLIMLKIHRSIHLPVHLFTCRQGCDIRVVPKIYWKCVVVAELSKLTYFED